MTRDQLDKFAYSMLAMHRRQVLRLSAPSWDEVGPQMQRLTRECVTAVLAGGPATPEEPKTEEGRIERDLFAAVVVALKPFLKG